MKDYKLLYKYLWITYTISTFFNIWAYVEILVNVEYYTFDIFYVCLFLFSSFFFQVPSFYWYKNIIGYKEDRLHDSQRWRALG